MGVVSQLYLESSNNTHYVALNIKKTTTIVLILLWNIIYYVSVCHNAFSYTATLKNQG